MIASSLSRPPQGNRGCGCRSTLPRMPFAALSQRARARKAARLRRLRPAFFCPRQRQAAIPCGNAVQRRKRWIRHNDRVNQRRGEVPSFAVSIRGIPKGGRNRNLPPFGVLSPHPLHGQRENGRRPGQNRKIQKKKNNVPSAHPRLILRPRDAIIPLHEHPL